MGRTTENGSTGVSDREDVKGSKSKVRAYLLWLFGGFLGAHHVYLGRDDHAFVYISTFGGYVGIGWLRDVYRIPAYVADANNDPAYVEDFKRKVRANRKVNKYRGNGDATAEDRSMELILERVALDP